MDQQSLDTLREADRCSDVVRLRFRNGSEVDARIRDVDWERHHTITYLDMDRACCAATADLDDITEVSLPTP